MGFALRSSSWPVEWPLALLVAAAALYAAGGWSSATAATAAKRWRGAAFYAGLVTLALAIDSPVDAYADRLFWVHMLQHVLLTAVAPPLLLLGRPWPRLIRPLPVRVRRPVARTLLAGPALALPRRGLRRLSDPLPSFALFTGVLLAWHLPALYDLTLRDGTVHDLEHALFFGTALLFWAHLVPSPAARRRLAAGPRVAYATAGMLVGWVLALVLGFAPTAVYAAYASLPSRPGGLTALADQQIAAGIMWVPASVPYTVAIFVAAYAWLAPAGTSDLRPRET